MGTASPHPFDATCSFQLAQTSASRRKSDLNVLARLLSQVETDVKKANPRGYMESSALPSRDDIRTANKHGKEPARVLIGGLVLLDVALVVLGLLLYPPVMQEDGLLGAGAAVLMVCLYGFLALYSPFSFSNVLGQIRRTGALVGTLAGIWLGLDLLSNYLIYRDGLTNSKISFVVYGVYLLLLVGTAIRGTAMTRQIRAGLAAALWYALVAQLIWFAVEFGAYYLFARTAVGAQFIQTEMQVDFVRSGAHDLGAAILNHSQAAASKATISGRASG